MTALRLRIAAPAARRACNAVGGALVPPPSASLHLTAVARRMQAYAGRLMPELSAAIEDGADAGHVLRAA